MEMSFSVLLLLGSESRALSTVGTLLADEHTQMQTVAGCYVANSLPFQLDLFSESGTWVRFNNNCCVELFHLFVCLFVCWFVAFLQTDAWCP